MNKIYQTQNLTFYNLREYPKTKPTDVYLYGTCLVDMMYPEAGIDAIKLLEREGIRVHFPQEQGCCGQAAYTSGYKDEAREVARAQMKIFKEDWPIVILSGSCGGTMIHKYPVLFEKEPELLQRANELSRRIYELGEFLLNVCHVKLKDLGGSIKVALHTSCSGRRGMDTHIHIPNLLAQLENVELVDFDHEEECCGFGGTFSVRMADISGAMVLDKTKSIKQSGAQLVVSVDCSCLMNITGSLEKQKEDIKGQHLATFLWSRTGGKA